MVNPAARAGENGGEPLDPTLTPYALNRRVGAGLGVGVYLVVYEGADRGGEEAVVVRVFPVKEVENRKVPLRCSYNRRGGVTRSASLREGSGRVPQRVAGLSLGMTKTFDNQADGVLESGEVSKAVALTPSTTVPNRIDFVGKGGVIESDFGDSKSFITTVLPQKPETQGEVISDLRRRLDVGVDVPRVVGTTGGEQRTKCRGLWELSQPRHHSPIRGLGRGRGKSGQFSS